MDEDFKRKIRIEWASLEEIRPEIFREIKKNERRNKRKNQ